MIMLVGMMGQEKIKEEGARTPNWVEMMGLEEQFGEGGR
jgi:hypothetical protein